MRKLRKWRDVLIKDLTADHEAAIGFLQAVLEDYQIYGDPAALMSALQAVIDAQGGIPELAKQTGMDPQTLLDALSGKTAPRVDMLLSILTALGYRLSIEPLQNTDLHPARGGVDTQIAPPKGIKSDMVRATDNK